MPRRRRRTAKISRPLKATKYSNETYCSAIVLENPAQSPAGSRASDYIPFIPPTTNILGTRKVKNFTVTFHVGETELSQGVAIRSAILWTMLFVPEGNTPLPMQFGGSAGAASLQEPNQNVIMSGILDGSQVYRFKTRLARNLNSGDGIVICLMDMNPKTDQNNPRTSVLITVNYAITF